LFRRRDEEEEANKSVRALKKRRVNMLEKLVEVNMNPALFPVGVPV